MSEREVMSWDHLGEGARELAQLVYDDGYQPDIVLAIARGGLLVAGALSYALGVKNTFTMNVEFYTGIDERLDVPMILPPVPDLVDFAETRCAVLYEKPRSIVRSEYVWRRTDRWIDFPWSVRAPVSEGLLQSI